MLEIRDLSTAYGPVLALDKVSFDVADGTITAVLGANGAGKTTLLRTISGLVRPKEGSVTYGGHDLTRMGVEDIVRLGISQVPEGRGVIQELTVEENLRLGSLWRRDRGDRYRALEEVYELFPPLAGRRGQSAFTLSGGERQMLALGRALMARPQVLLLDEPSLGLAPLVTAQIMGRLRHLTQRAGTTILLVEQNARSALSIADQAVVLSLGRVVLLDRASAVAGNAELRHHYLGF
ncbi:MAG TPA: ABC transporter ATP-binding protein [Acidimicrobiales bacterium]|jgi:branched-chain amino acid transport system ATP-binding protein|nr:ABC transporter ATP-binding protein [Acidimicrobiales bacterium]